MRESESMTRVRDARAGLLLTHPFFGVLSLKLALIENAAVKTALVTTAALSFNPAYIETLSNGQVKTLVAHEVFHLALLHHARQGARDGAMWNDAGDYAVNAALAADGFEPIPGWLIDPRFDGKSAESIYQTLRDEKQEPEPDQQPQPQPQQSPQGQPQQGAGGQPQAGQGDAQGQPQPGEGQGNPCGSFAAAGPEDSAEAGEAAREWQENANEALRAASGAGKLPAGIKCTVTEAINAKADWRALLRRFMTDQLKTRSTWSKRNKRFSDVYLPGRIADGMGCLVVAVDTSGSISQAVLNRFSAEISAICEDVEPAQVHVVYCDAKVNRVDTFESGEPVKLSACGGGGTRFSPVFERVAAENWTPAALVYLTDLDCSDYPNDPGYPVLWAGYGAEGRTAPVGETIHID